VIDGDTIEIHGQRVRLFGIDAPESRQPCTSDGTVWRCGQKAAFALADLVGWDWVRCENLGWDRYKRIVGICYLDDLSINSWMVRQGWALDYTQYSKGRFAKEEAEARLMKRGIWQGEFDRPWDWRRAQSSTSSTPGKSQEVPNSGDTASCQIKGNINSRGEQIYHVPGGAFYGQTRIDTARGEHWFFTESEAQAAGWRRSKR
jgi:endonuclease YncB( thermonuclease family)